MMMKNKPNLFKELRKEENPYAVLEYKKQFTCTKCGKTFMPIKNYQIFCSSDCENVHTKIVEKVENDRYNGKCIYCTLTFRRNYRHQKSCYTCTKQIAKQESQECEKSKKVEKIPKKRKKVPLEELIRRSEHKRVWDNKGWDHYLNGRRWNRI